MADLSQVAKLIPKLATDQTGELVATRDAIVRALFAMGFDLHDLAESVRATPAARQEAPGLPSFGDLARACRDGDRGRLTARERDFVQQMCRMGFVGRPSQRQIDWLTSIFACLQRRAAA